MRWWLWSTMLLPAAVVSMIVPPPAPLKNSYFAIRHGQSTANVANIISSDPLVGSTTHELTALGKEQAREAGEALWHELAKGGYGVEACTIYSSNFTRARETKDAAAFELMCERRSFPRIDRRRRRRQLATHVFDGPPVRLGLLEALRERNFGDLDGLNTGAYDVVWPRDLGDPTADADGVEPVAAVCARLLDMVTLLESRHTGEAIGLVSHADVLQIFQCWMGGVDVRTFSSYRFKNGEVRLCDAAASALPPPIPMVSQANTAA